MLAYSSIQPARPWLVTALGITSIVIASLSLLTALWSGLVFIPMAMLSGQSFAPAMPAVQTTPAKTITSQDADLIAATLAGQQPLAPADQALLSQAIQLAEIPMSPPLDGQWTPEHVTGQLINRSTSNDGTTLTTTFTFSSGGDISLSAGTATVSFWDANGGYTYTTVSNGSVTSSSSGAMGGVTPFTEIPRIAVFASGLSVVLSLGLAALLLVAGIQTLRSSPSGRSLHLWWAWPKIAAAILGSFATYYFWNGMFLAGGPGSSEDFYLAMVFAAGGLLIALAWPIVVLLLLRTRSLREYYNPAEAIAA